MINQKEAVFQAISEVFSLSGQSIEPGSVVNDIITKDQKAQVNTFLCEGFRAGKIQLATEYPTDVGLKSYVSGLINNWLRKDTRLNGGVKYEAKNPGSRAGSSNPQIKAMRALLKTMDASDPRRSTVEQTLNAHLEQERAAKQKVTVNLSDLPEELRAQFIKDEE